jgi:hypothetical protein
VKSEEICFFELCRVSGLILIRITIKIYKKNLLVVLSDKL